MTGCDWTGEPLVAPTAARNRDAILAVRRRVLPREGLVVEDAVEKVCLILVGSFDP